MWPRPLAITTEQRLESREPGGEAAFSPPPPPAARGGGGEKHDQWRRSRCVFSPGLPGQQLGHLSNGTPAPPNPGDHPLLKLNHASQPTSTCVNWNQLKSTGHSLANGSIPPTMVTVVDDSTATNVQSCKMSRIYPCKNIGNLCQQYVHLKVTPT